MGHLLLSRGKGAPVQTKARLTIVVEFGRVPTKVSVENAVSEFRDTLNGANGAVTDSNDTDLEEEEVELKTADLSIVEEVTVSVLPD